MTLSLSHPEVLLPPENGETGAPLPTAGLPPAAGAGAPAVLPSATASLQAPALDVVEEWGLGSFPASDPPSNW